MVVGHLGAASRARCPTSCICLVPRLGQAGEMEGPHYHCVFGNSDPPYHSRLFENRRRCRQARTCHILGYRPSRFLQSRALRGHCTKRYDEISMHGYELSLGLLFNDDQEYCPQHN